MRSIVAVIAVVAAAAAASPAAAGPALSVTRAQARWFPLRHELVVQTAWAPSKAATDVSLSVSSGSQPLRTLRAPHWLIGAKTFQVLLPRTLPAGTVLDARLTLSSSAGKATRTLHVTL